MANDRTRIGEPLDGRETWKVDDTFSSGAPFRWTNEATPSYSVVQWHGQFVACLTGNILRGRLGRKRVFRSSVAAAIAAEQHYAERVATVREVNEAQRASESRDYPSHDRGASS